MGHNSHNAIFYIQLMESAILLPEAIQTEAVTLAQQLGRSLYDRDFHQWTQVMAEALRSGDWAGLDVENLIDEVESLGRQQRQELRNRLGMLLGHLLKWQFQPMLRCSTTDQRSTKSWKLTLREQRAQIRFLLKDNPSLKSYLEEAMEDGYTLGQLLVAKETPLEVEDLPQVCPYGLDDAIDDAFFPESE